MAEDKTEHASRADTLSYSDAQAPAPAAGQAIELGPGALVGRYVVLSKVGEGGMGAVFAAHDPELDRKVALKFLHSKLTGSDRGQVEESRLFREAQAMAKLSHPNVCTVYDVGSYRGRVYLAMEFIDGQTFGDWLEAEPRTWSEIWPLLRGAGRGLAAAHAAGVIHRDFKPDNILVSSDGVAKVTDFGLAAPSGEAADTDDADDTASSSGALHEPLTRTGSIVGTPRYMAPEQHLARATTERTDQFAFCLVAFRAMYGEHAFVGDTVADLATAVTGGELVEPARRSLAPSWRHHAVVRGLSTNPDDRFASMEALLAALGTNPAARRNRVLAGGAVVAAAGAALFVLWPSQTTRRAALCTASAEAMEPTWNAQARERIRSAFKASGSAIASGTAKRVVKLVDDYADKWIDMHQQSCLATHLRGEQSAELLDLRGQCLARRRARLHGLIEVLQTSPTKATVRNAVEAARGLPQLDDCADPRRLRALSPPPADADTARLEELQAGLGRAYSLWDTSDSQGALAALEPLIEPITKSGYARLIGEARALQFKLLGEQTRFDEAKQAFDVAVEHASRAGDDRRVAQLWLNQVLHTGSLRHKLQEGLAYARMARAAIHRAGSDPTQLAQYHFVLADALRDGGKFEQARSHANKALEILLTRRPEDAVRIGRVYGLLANIEDSLRKVDEGEVHALKSIDLLEGSLGRNHIEVGRSLLTLSSIQSMKGRQAQAVASMRRAWKIHRDTFGADADETLDTAAGLAFALKQSLDYKAADKVLTPLVAAVDARKLKGIAANRVLRNAGEVKANLGDQIAARKLLERAVKYARELGGDYHPSVFSTRMVLVGVCLAAKDWECAIAEARASTVVAKKVLPPNHPAHAIPLAMEGMARMGQGKPRQALPLFRASLAHGIKAKMSPFSLAWTRLYLARALIALGPANRAQAITEARRAHAAFLSFGGARGKKSAESSAEFLAKHGAKHR